MEEDNKKVIFNPKVEIKKEENILKNVTNKVVIIPKEDTKKVASIPKEVTKNVASIHKDETKVVNFPKKVEISIHKEENIKVEKKKPRKKGKLAIIEFRQIAKTCQLFFSFQSLVGRIWFLGRCEAKTEASY